MLLRRAWFHVAGNLLVLFIKFLKLNGGRLALKSWLLFFHHGIFGLISISWSIVLLLACPCYQGAVVFSNIVTTVSPTYAQEVRSSEVWMSYAFVTALLAFPNFSLSNNGAINETAHTWLVDNYQSFSSYLLLMMFRVDEAYRTQLIHIQRSLLEFWTELILMHGIQQLIPFWRFSIIPMILMAKHKTKQLWGDICNCLQLMTDSHW